MSPRNRLAEKLVATALAALAPWGAPAALADSIAQQAYFKASNTNAEDEFGLAVGVSGDIVAIGAPWEDSDATGVNGNQYSERARDSGAVYVFVRSGGIWAQQAYLKASNTEEGDHFGYSLAISGDTLVVGAPTEDSHAYGVDGNQGNEPTLGADFDAGAAFVFVRDVDGLWQQQAYLKASNPDAIDYFGKTVAISGDTIVIGAYAEDSPATGVNGEQGDGMPGSGAAYVFTRNGTTWSQQAYLKASNTGSGDGFGEPVAISGDTIIVGALYESSAATGVNGDQSDNSLTSAGAAYVFVRSGSTWSQEAYLKASNTGGNDRFGIAVAVAGSTAVVGALWEDSAATGINGNQASNAAQNSGAAYVFARTNGVWSQQAYLKASNTGSHDEFGGVVAASAERVIVGATHESSNATGVDGDQNNNLAGGSGAAYVFIRDDTTWSQEAYLKASNTGSTDLFGGGVCVVGDTIVVTSIYEDSNAVGVDGDQSDNSAFNAGSAYVFAIALPCPGNLDGDGDVDLQDLSLLLVNFGRTDDPTGAEGDLDDDGDTDLADLTTLLANFGASCE